MSAERGRVACAQGQLQGTETVKVSMRVFSGRTLQHTQTEAKQDGEETVPTATVAKQHRTTGKVKLHPSSEKTIQNWETG